MKNLLTSTLFFLASTLLAQNATQPYQGKFETIDRLLEPPSPYRTASGAPGAEYWQQKADYRIDAILDENKNTLTGKETITYYNYSPDELKILWIQLEQNINRKGNEEFNYLWGGMSDSISSQKVQYMLRPDDFRAGTDITSITDEKGKKIDYIINNTMMRLDLPTPLAAGTRITFTIEWINYITDRSKFLLSREGYEYFPKDDNKIFLFGHWFPRMAVYNDTEGWQNKQFQRLGEFALEFGDYEVRITVPADHIVAATGSLINEKDVLTSEQLIRLATAKKSFDKNTWIITPEEASTNEGKKEKGTKTWIFKAENVRDVAFASSRKFAWDARAVKLPTNTVMAMSFFPNEGMPVWSEESTQAIKNALEVYSEATFDYPYPVAISVNTANLGMEFPMISFNGGRPTSGEISDGERRGMTSTIIHEVGHNWFPMIVSSDERKWMWMDEGLNTFLHQRTLAERYPKWHSTVPKDIVPFMNGDQSILRPIMVNSDNDLLYQMGSNFYQKPTVGFQMLRNTIVGRELFDRAFKEYANRWKYKHPNPSDLFRTLEDQTAVDLDWFWKGWYFTTDVVDIELSEVKWFTFKEESVAIEGKGKKAKGGPIKGNKNGQNADANSFSDGPQELTLMPTADHEYGQFLSRLDEGAIRDQLEGKNIYELTFENKGGLVMPIIIEWNYNDGSKETQVIPAEVWRHDESKVTKQFMKEKEVISIRIDPNQQLPDVNLDNNVFPKVKTESKFDQFKEGK